MNLNVTISIDDVNPKPGWNIFGTPVEGWLRSLNEEFGAKFTLFCPANYHSEHPLSQYRSWINDISSDPKYEIAAHGHFHMTSDPKRFGECEFAELGAHECEYRLRDMQTEFWDTLGYCPVGWKSPGWLINEYNKTYIESQFDYVSLHYDHNHDLKWNCKTFFGHDGIHQTDIKVHNVYMDNYEVFGMIMLTSHIAGDWNDNVWNETNYEQLRLSLRYLTENYNCEFRLMQDCI